MPLFESRTLLAVLAVTLATPAFAQSAPSDSRRTSKDAELKKATSASPDKSLAGDITREKQTSAAAPTLRYDQFRLDVELQVASKRREQIESLRKIIALSPDPAEAPGLLFRLGELYWEESKYYFFEAARKDDDIAAAMNAKDEAALEKAKAEKARLEAKRKEFSQAAVDQYSQIVQRYKNYERTDEVLYFLGHNLTEAGEDRKALVAFKRLIDKFPKSRFIPDAHLAFGEFYFNSSLGKRELLDKALDAYKKAASYPESSVYGFALYKQGWCYFNMSDYQRAMDMFKAVVLYGELSGDATTQTNVKGKSSLVREARNDFVRAYSRYGAPADARAEFSKVASKPEDRFLMLKQLANLYYDDGKDREAALTFASLIKEKPLSPEAPFFQAKIVDCVLRAGNKRMTVEQVRRLVKINDDVRKAGVAKDDKDKKALAQAGELAERTLSNIAVNWHNEAKKTRDEETFEFANEVYSDYLALFPNNPKAYDLRFFWAELLNDNLRKFPRAAEEYTRVVMIDIKRIEGDKDAKDEKARRPGKPGKWLVNAAYNAVLAYDEIVKDAEAKGVIKNEVKGSEKTAIPKQKLALLEACDRYLKYVPKGDKRVEIAFKMGNVYYRHNHFDEAVARFSDIALKHPEYKFENGEPAGEIAANLVLDSYNLTKDWEKLNQWARKFRAQENLGGKDFRENLAKVLEQSSFKLVNQLEERQQFADAGEAYLRFVSEFPRSEIADRALYNASIDFFKGKQIDRAVETRARLISKYPNSPYVPGAMFANAESLEALGDFDAAADAFEAYAAGWEKNSGRTPNAKSAKRKKVTKTAPPPAAPGKGEEAPAGWETSKAQVALLNAGVYREGLGQFKQALRIRERFLELWPTAKEAEAVDLSIADLYERMGQHGKSIAHLERYERDHSRDHAKVLMAEGRIVRLYSEKLRRPREAARVHRRVLDYYGKLGPKGRKSLDDASLDAVARAHNEAAEEDYKRFAALRLKWGRMPAPEKEFKENLKAKLKALEVVKSRYTETVAFKQGAPAICALYKMGSAYDAMVDALVNVPMPKAFPDEVQDALREEFNKTAEPIRGQAAEAFSTAVQKARELNVHNDCARRSLALLRETYRPDQYPLVQEEVAELKPRGNLVEPTGFLAAVQPVSVTFRPDGAKNRPAAREARPPSDAPPEETPTEPEAPVEQAPPQPAAEPQEPEDYL